MKYIYFLQDYYMILLAGLFYLLILYKTIIMIKEAHREDKPKEIITIKEAGNNTKKKLEKENRRIERLKLK